MDVYDFILIGMIAVISIFFLVGLFRAMFIPLPPWNELHGEEYLKWKRGENAEADSGGD